MWVFLRTCVWYAHHWDVALSDALTLRPDQRSRAVARRVAHLGDSVLWLAGALAAYLATRRAGRSPARARQLLLLLLLSAATTLALKALVRRARPGPLEPLMAGPGPDQHSFPSGHAVRMAAIAVWAGSIHRGWGVAAALLAAAVGWSRIRLGVHFVGDVVVGYAVGGIVAASVRRVCGG